MENITENTNENTNKDNSVNGITLNDLVKLRNIINIASRRGAFSADEFKEIGEVYTQLDGFLKEQIGNVDEKVVTDENVVTDEGLVD